jgi:hypothetical protein
MLPNIDNISATGPEAAPDGPSSLDFYYLDYLATKNSSPVQLGWGFPSWTLLKHHEITSFRH